MPVGGKQKKGEDKDLFKAIAKAWDDQREPGDPNEYKVEIYVYGNNPITGYRVFLNPT